MKGAKMLKGGESPAKMPENSKKITEDTNTDFIPNLDEGQVPARFAHSSIAATNAETMEILKGVRERLARIKQDSPEKEDES